MKDGNHRFSEQLVVKYVEADRAGIQHQVLRGESMQRFGTLLDEVHQKLKESPESSLLGS